MDGMTRERWVLIHTTGVFQVLAKFAGQEHEYFKMLENDFNYNELFACESSAT